MENYAWLAILTLAQIVQFLIVKRNGKGYKYNPHPPGESRTCIDNAKAIVELQTEVKNIKSDIHEIKEKL